MDLSKTQSLLINFNLFSCMVAAIGSKGYILVILSIENCNSGPKLMSGTDIFYGVCFIEHKSR